MARTVNAEDYLQKRSQILDAAQHFVFEVGWEQTSTHAILAQLRISSGAFYHYFDSKPALLEAVIERLVSQSVLPLQAIAADPALSALAKLQRFLGTLDSLRVEHAGVVVRLFRIWYTDDNASVRQKLDEALLRQRVPLIDAIVQQGVREGSFNPAHPENTGEIIVYLLLGMGNAHARLMLSPELAHQDPDCIAKIVALHAAYMDALERVLGLPGNPLYRADTAAVTRWAQVLGAAPGDKKQARKGKINT